MAEIARRSSTRGRSWRWSCDGELEEGATRTRPARRRIGGLRVIDCSRRRVGRDRRGRRRRGAAVPAVWQSATARLAEGRRRRGVGRRGHGRRDVASSCYLALGQDATMRPSGRRCRMRSSCRRMRAVILVLASLAGAFPGYGVAAIMLLYLFAFVSRTRFVFAAARSVVIAAAFLVAVVMYDGPESLALDVLFFVTATAGSLLALHILEHARRRVFFQDLVIREQSEAIAPGAREVRSAASQRDAGVDLGAASRGRVGSRRRVPVRHRDVCRHRRVHAIGRRAPGRGRRAAAQCALLVFRRPRRGTWPREDQDHRGQLHGGRRPPGTARWTTRRVDRSRARAGHDLEAPSSFIACGREVGDACCPADQLRIARPFRGVAVRRGHVG